MKFKRFFILPVLLLCGILLAGCSETEAEGALRRLKRAMNEVISIADELDMLNDTDLDIERYQSAIAIENGSAGDSTGSLPKPVESFLGIIDESFAAHQSIIQTRSDLHLTGSRIETLVNRIRNDDALEKGLDVRFVNEIIDELNQAALDLTETIGQVVRVYNRISPDLDHIIANLDNIVPPFEGILSSLNRRLSLLDGVRLNLAAAETNFLELVSTNED